jgi:hypothetical protein
MEHTDRRTVPGEAAIPLGAPPRYKVARSGRGAAKSWSFARALLLQGQAPKAHGWTDRDSLRVVCCRETQKSIAQSVHQLLKDQIVSLSLQGFYEVQQDKIIGRNGTNFGFEGLKHNIDNIKSLEGADVVWVEEGQTVWRLPRRPPQSVPSEPSAVPSKTPRQVADSAVTDQALVFMIRCDGLSWCSQGILFQLTGPRS